MRNWIVAPIYGAVMMAILPTEGLAMENPIRPIEPVTFQLDNGLTVFVVEDHSVPLVAIDINYSVGSKNERTGKTGFAHLFEHLMFQGSKNQNDDYFKPLQDIGGQVNGATSTDRTRYWEVVPSEHLDRALWMEADRMGFLLEALTDKRLENQRSVVMNERRQNYDNRPYGLVWERMAAVMFPAGHPYSWLTIGSLEDISAANRKDVEDFFQTYYTPNNATLAIVGDVDVERAKASVLKYFGTIPPGPPVSRIAKWVPRIFEQIDLAIEDRVQLPRIYVSWPTTPLYDEDDAALDVFGHVLGGGKTSRLHQELVHRSQIAQDAVAIHRSMELAGVFDMIVNPMPGHSLAEVEKAAFEVLEKTLEHGITAAELDRCVTTVTAEYVRDLQNIGGFGGIADRLNAYAHFRDKPDLFSWDLQRYLDLTPKKVNEIARKYLGGKGRVVARVTPLGDPKASADPVATGLDRSVVPGPGPASSFKLPDRHHRQLSNGIPVVTVEHSKLPLVSVVMIFKGGSSMDPAGLPGLASLTASLMNEGSDGKSSQDFAEAIEGIGAHLDISTATDATLVTMSTLKDRMGTAMDLMADLVLRPNMAQEEFDRVKARRLGRLLQFTDQAQYMAHVGLRQILYPNHPYGHPAMGTPAGISAITLEDTLKAHKTMFSPANCTIVVVGDGTADEITGSLNKVVGKWKNDEIIGVANLPEMPQHDKRTVYLVDRPGSAQSIITAGLVGVNRRVSDFAAIEVMNTAFGGQFVSRLNLNLRENKGYTYGARSRFDFGVVAGPFSASAPVDAPVTGAALKELINEIADISGAKPLTAEELRYAKDSIVNGYAQRFATPGQIASELVDVYLFGLEEDAPETLPARIAEVDTSAVEDAGSRLLPVDKLAIVVVGDAKVVRPQIEALNLGPIVDLKMDFKVPGAE